MENFGCKSFAKPTNCYFLEFRAYILRLAVRKKSAGLSCCFLRLQGNFLRKIFFKSFCIFCGPFFRSFPVIEQENFARPVKTAFIVSIKSFWKKTLLENKWNFSSFSDIELEVFGFMSSFSTGMLELHSTFPR